MKLYSINTGFFKLDGGAMFGVVPKSLWKKTNPPDANNMCSWSMRCLLIETTDNLILIDTGIGNKQSEKFFSYFHLHGDDKLIDSIEKHGFKKNDITDVILTHLHFDHCGGAVTQIDNEYHLLFPNANYWTNKKHWKWANNPNEREKASFLKENFIPIKEKNKLKFLEEGFFCDGIEIKFFNGHTDSQIIPFIKWNNKTIVFCADLLPSIGHIPLPYIMGYDIRPLTTLIEKEKFLNEAVEKDYILFLEHDYYNECCSIMKINNKYSVKKKGKLNDFLNS